MASSQQPTKILYSYEADEFVKYEKSFAWYAIVCCIGLVLLIYAVLSKSPMTFLVFFIVLILTLLVSIKDPRRVTISITSIGIVIDKKMLYQYDNIEHFGVFSDPPVNFISLYLETGLMRYVRIPLGEEDPEQIAELIEQFIERKDGQEKLIDKLDHLMKL